MNEEAAGGQPTSDDGFARQAQALRERLGPVGAWMALVPTPAAEERSAAQRIEELGYGALWIPEGPFTKESFSHAGTLLGATERLAICTGIANLWMREPAAMAAGAATLGEAHDGRFVLGMGVSHKPLVEQLGREASAGPLTTMRRYLEGMDAAPYGGPSPVGGTPRLLGALRPKMLGLARDRAAGAHPYFVPVEHTRRAREALGPDRFLAPELAFVLERDPGRAREVARAYTGPHFSPEKYANYVNSMLALGYAEEDLADGGSERIVDDLIAWGDEEAIAARVRAHLEAGADHVALQPLGADLPEALARLAALRPALPR